MCLQATSLLKLFWAALAPKALPRLSMREEMLTDLECSSRNCVLQYLQHSSSEPLCITAWAAKSFVLYKILSQSSHSRGWFNFSWFSLRARFAKDRPNLEHLCFVSPRWTRIGPPEIYLRSNNLIAVNPWGSYWELTFTKIAFLNYLPTFDPHLTPQGLFKIKLFWRSWISWVQSFPSRCFTTIIYFWPYWPLTLDLTTKESFFGP
jgi:hypothetical protein